MTTIARRDNIIACDSRYVMGRGNVGITTDQGIPKLYLHPTKMAVIAISGFCTHPGFFKYISGLIDQMVLDQFHYPDNLTLKGGDIQDYIRKEKLVTYKFIVIVAGKNLTTLLSFYNDTVDVQYFRPHEPVIVGTGQLTLILSSTNSTAVEYVRAAMRIDDQTGGTIFQTNLNNLESL